MRALRVGEKGDLPPRPPPFRWLWWWRTRPSPWFAHSGTAPHTLGGTICAMRCF